MLLTLLGGGRGSSVTEHSVSSTTSGNRVLMFG